MGLDVGSKTIGIAVSDELGIAAHPVTTLARAGTAPDAAAVAALVADARGHRGGGRLAARARRSRGPARPAGRGVRGGAARRAAGVGRHAPVGRTVLDRRGASASSSRATSRGASASRSWTGRPPLTSSRVGSTPGAPPGKVRTGPVSKKSFRIALAVVVGSLVILGIVAIYFVNKVAGLSRRAPGRDRGRGGGRDRAGDELPDDRRAAAREGGGQRAALVPALRHAPRRHHQGPGRRVQAQGQHDARGGARRPSSPASRTSCVNVTIPEGLNMLEVFELIGKAGVAQRRRAGGGRRAIRSSSARHGITGDTVDGYLFPETYKFKVPSTAEAVLGKMVEQHRIVWDELQREHGKDDREAQGEARLDRSRHRHDGVDRREGGGRRRRAPAHRAGVHQPAHHPGVQAQAPARPTRPSATAASVPGRRSRTAARSGTRPSGCTARSSTTRTTPTTRTSPRGPAARADLQPGRGARSRDRDAGRLDYLYFVAKDEQVARLRADGRGARAQRAELPEDEQVKG